MGLLGYTKRTSFKAAISTAQVSEFSLVLLLLGNSQGMVSQNLVVIITIIALISIACSAYLIIYSDSLYKLADKYFTLFERRKTHFEQDGRHRYDLVLFGYRKGGHEFLKTFQSLGKPFVVVDYDPEVIDMLEHLKVNFLYGDAGDIELLDEIGLERSKLVVSTITDYSTTSVLLPLILSRNPGLVVICHAESKQQADQLYDLGASYVMMPHFLGSKKISDFIKHSGIKKSEFKKFREQHLAYLHSRSNANIEE
jgi:Trk K+ transport system NAD-binding subunit